MVRCLVLYNKPDDVEAVERQYREVHIPLTKKLPGLRRCTISRNAMPVRGGEPFYLVAELDSEDMAAMRQDFQSKRRPGHRGRCGQPGEVESRHPQHGV